MAEIVGKIGALYAAYGAGVATYSGAGNEEVVALAGTTGIGATTGENIKVSHVYEEAEGPAKGDEIPSSKYTWTVKGTITCLEKEGENVYVDYVFWEEGDYGVAGKIGQVAGFFGWSFNRVGDALETTDYSDAGHRTYIAGLAGWTGSAEKHWITEYPLEWVNTELIIKFYVNITGTLRYEGWGLVTGHGVTSAVDTLVNESLSFQGDGILSYESS